MVCATQKTVKTLSRLASGRHQADASVDRHAQGVSTDEICKRIRLSSDLEADEAHLVKNVTVVLEA